MPEQHGRDEEAPDQRVHAAEAAGRRARARPWAGCADRWRSRKRSSGNRARSATIVRSVRFQSRAHDPADVRVPEPAQPRRVDVLRGVRILVVPAVVAGPPEHALLRGALRAEREQELERARRLERPVREVAVVAGGHHDHADEVGAEGQRGARPGPAARDDADHRSDMYAQNARDVTRKYPALDLAGRRRRFGSRSDRRCCCGRCVHDFTLTAVRSRPVRTWSRSRRPRPPCSLARVCPARSSTRRSAASRRAAARAVE